MSTELSIKHTCPICKGSLVYSRLVPTYQKDEAWVLTETPCPCMDTETPGYEILYNLDITDLSDKIDDILDKVNDIKEKLDE